MGVDNESRAEWRRGIKYAIFLVLIIPAAGMVIYSARLRRELLEVKSELGALSSDDNSLESHAGERKESPASTEKDEAATLTLQRSEREEPPARTEEDEAVTLTLQRYEESMKEAIQQALRFCDLVPGNKNILRIIRDGIFDPVHTLELPAKDRTAATALHARLREEFFDAISNHESCPSLEREGGVLPYRELRKVGFELRLQPHLNIWYVIDNSSSWHLTQVTLECYKQSGAVMEKTIGFDCAAGQACPVDPPFYVSECRGASAGVHVTAAQGFEEL